jgi:hypothetical protein
MIYLSALLAGEYMDDSILAVILYIKYKRNAVLKIKVIITN